jgi:hypothetical protein
MYWKIFWKSLLFFLVIQQQIACEQTTLLNKNQKKLEFPVDVEIVKNGISIPIGFILAVRRNSEHCAVKFTDYWTGESEMEQYAKYESYYQNDKTGNLLNNNAQHTIAELSRPKSYGIGRLSFNFGNKDIQCGPIRLFWTGRNWVYFHKEGQAQGDYGIELAPTPWTAISQVDVSDRRLKWYRYDEGRTRIKIPIDRLWADEAVKK